VTVYASRPWRLQAAACRLRLHQRQKESRRIAAHAGVQQGTPRRAGHRGRGDGDDRVRRHL